MGKRGKELKKRRTDRVVALLVTAESDDEESDNEANQGGEQAGEEGGEREQDVAQSVLSTLGQNLPLYAEKWLKPLRQALYPLVQRQSDKFFEDAVGHLDVPVEQVGKLLSADNVRTTIRLIDRYSSDNALFDSLDGKDFRRAMHPLVVYHKSAGAMGDTLAGSSGSRKGKFFVALSSSGTALDSTHTHTHTNTSTSTDAPTRTHVPANLTVGDASAAAVHSIDAAHANASQRSLSNQISHAFRARDWLGALRGLRLLRKSSDETAKLGSLQRWVREATVEQSDCPVRVCAVNLSLLLLDAILRVMWERSSGGAGEKDVDGEGEGVGDGMWELRRFARVVHSPPFLGHPAHTPSPSSHQHFPSVLQRRKLVDRVRVVSHVVGAERRPPSAHDLHVFMTLPGIITFEDSAASVSASASTVAASTVAASASSSSSASASASASDPNPHRLPVPHVPGCFLLHNILSTHECAQLLHASECIGYVPDAVEGIDNIQWLADESLLKPIFDRCEKLLPPEIDGCKLAGINARWRLFRYFSGAVYRPHIDGAWPGSGLKRVDTGETVDAGMVGMADAADGGTADAASMGYKAGAGAGAAGTYASGADVVSDAKPRFISSDYIFTDDCFGDRQSKLTFLIYLNGGFEGGRTTFFLPEGHTEGSKVVGGDAQYTGVVHAHSVTPQAGSVLCFRHGDALASLVHEGSNVTHGCKYVLRSDVLYYHKKPTGGRGRGGVGGEGGEGGGGREGLVGREVQETGKRSRE